MLAVYVSRYKSYNQYTVLEAITSWTVTMVTFDSKQCLAAAQNEMQQAVTFARCSEYEVLRELSIRETRNSSVSVCFSLFLTLNFSLFFLFCSLILLLVSCLFYNIFVILSVIFIFILRIFLYVTYRQD